MTAEMTAVAAVIFGRFLPRLNYFVHISGSDLTGLTGFLMSIGNTRIQNRNPKTNGSSEIFWCISGITSRVHRALRSND